MSQVSPEVTEGNVIIRGRRVAIVVISVLSSDLLGLCSLTLLERKAGHGGAQYHYTGQTQQYHTYSRHQGAGAGGERRVLCGLGPPNSFLCKVGSLCFHYRYYFLFLLHIFFLFKPSYCIILTDYINIIFYFVNSFNNKNSG